MSKLIIFRIFGMHLVSLVSFTARLAQIRLRNIQRHLYLIRLSCYIHLHSH